MKTCKDCLHYEACSKTVEDANCIVKLRIECAENCEDFTDRSEWVHLPSSDYTFTIRGDIAKELLGPDKIKIIILLTGNAF